MEGKELSACLGLGPEKWTMLLPLTKEPGQSLAESGNQLILELGKSLRERLFSTGELKIGDKF